MTTVTTSVQPGSTVASLASPASTSNGAYLIALQGGYNAPRANTIQIVTNPLIIPPTILERMSNFSENVYSLTDESLIVKFMKVLLGMAGAGQTRSLMLQARLQSIFSGANFYELDSFFGAIFGINRLSDERFIDSNGFTVDPYNSLQTYDQWTSVRMADASYRSRIEQFAAAIEMGPCVLGLQMVCEAILQTNCDIIEGWVLDDFAGYTYTDLQGHNYSYWQSYTYNELETGGDASNNRKTFAIIPHRTISTAEAFALQRVIDTLKPADSWFTIEPSGYQVFDEVPITNVDADNWFWHLREALIPNPAYADIYNVSPTSDPDGYYEVLRPPYCEYQGERVVYNEDIAVVLGYELDSTGATLPGQVIDSYTFSDGTRIYYPPNQALAARGGSLATRLVSEGVLQGNIYSEFSQGGAFATPIDLYVDGINITDLAGALNYSGINQNPVPDNQFYWSTPPRLASDQTTEVFEARLSSARYINNIYMQLATYPQMATLQVMYPGASMWTTVATYTIQDSVPSEIPVAPTSLHENPQHSGSGHWQDWLVNIGLQYITAIRVLLLRIDSTNVPTTFQSYSNIVSQNGLLVPLSQPAPYALGIKSCVIAYEVAQRSDLIDQPIYSEDVLGSNVKWTVREELPTNAVQEEGIWRCDPQPSPDAVVNFYVDMRDENGVGQTIDAFEIDPLYTGPHVSLYYSNDDPQNLPALSSSQPVELTSQGTVLTSAAGVVFPSTTVSYLDLDNTDLQWVPDKPWWLGLVVTPNFNSVSAAGQIIFSYAQSGYGVGDVNTLSFITSGGNTYLQFAYVGGGSPIQVPVSFSMGEALTIILGFQTSQSTTTNYMQLWCQQATNSNEGYGVGPVNNYGGVTDIYFGGNPTASVSGNMSISTVVLAQNTLQDPSASLTVPAGDVANFYSNPTQYTLLPTYANDDPTGFTNNTLLRLDPSFVSSTNTYGFKGGLPKIWPYINWIPINFSYQSRKGIMRFNPTQARFWKFEFTNLAANQINVFTGITKTVQTMPSINTVQSPKIGPPGDSGSQSIGVSQNIQMAGAMYFGDQLPAAALTADPTIIPSTAAQVVTDATLASALAGQSYLWRFTEWQPSPIAPKFLTTQTHDYSTDQVVMTGKIGFFVGLNSISALRHNFFSENDTSIYDEYFSDNMYIESGYSWNLD